MMRSLGLLSLALVLWNCEDPVTLQTDFDAPQLVVDAWLTNRAEPQTVRLTESQDYYANRLPTPVEDAAVVICRTAPDTSCFTFTYRGDGDYVWEPAPGDSLGAVGTELVLGLERNGLRYGSQTTVKRVPPIDSIAVRFEEESIGLDAGLYAQLYARDFVGVGDAYLIRTTINDTLLNRPGELSLVYDATFDAGSGTDGIVFIAPIRFSINRTDDDGGVVALEPGDSLHVDVWSLSNEAFFYLSVARDQIQNGSNGIFQLPIANAPGNVVALDGEEAVLGVFNVAAVSQASKVVE
ncbi:uncharacterized protein DUF4249 [Neolewinella xylanilytica]|uniref:Uncharacterized protein DUF4249 n=1 Tax=Neolewinella xylanilytica TaxID=1514080 RepID=A0A2S6I886_9BACT|nr:DUF4249 domain-containing protein [Neolewinella xylanilytica]PPK87705.1 uncharacterized protein DUF4249 [Neolewinella xylanilytica]